MSNTGYKAYTDLEQYYINSGIATGVTKTNSTSDPDYVAPVYDTTYCPLPSATPSVTPSVTPTISVTPTVTPSVTPSISSSPLTTPSNSVTPSISVTPSVTPTISKTPSITPTPSITSSVPTTYNYYEADRYECFSGNCSYIETINIANPSVLIEGKFYLDSINNYIFNIVNTSLTGPYLYTSMSGFGTNNCNTLCSIIP